MIVILLVALREGGDESNATSANRTLDTINVKLRKYLINAEAMSLIIDHQF